MAGGYSNNREEVQKRLEQCFVKTASLTI